jgi:hypothetical protein
MPFQKGHKGFGSTKRKRDQLLRKLLPLEPQALDALKDMLTNPDDRAFAVKFILENLHGRAPQRLEHTGEDGSPLGPIVAIIKDA